MTSNEKRLFLSYAHDDTLLARRVVESLPRQLPNCRVEIESDFALAPGTPWLDQLHSGLERADIAVLLVSSSFASSRFVNDVELPLLKQRREQGKVHLLWLPVDAAGDKWAEESGLGALQAVGRRTLIGRQDGKYLEAGLDTLEDDVSRLLDPEGFALAQSLNEKYTLHERIGEGRTWHVYRAKDDMLDRSVAIFVPVGQQSSPSAIEDAVRMACRRSSNSNVATVYGAWLDAAVPHVVTQFANHGTVAGAISSAIEETGRGLQCEKVRDLLLQLARTLSVEARALDVHPLDVRPAKILMDKPAGYLLSPFGHWRGVGKQLRQHLASEASTPEERAYVAPEQLAIGWCDRIEEKTKDRTYQYLLGLLGWHALTGVLPRPHDGVDVFPSTAVVEHCKHLPSPNADAPLCSPWLASLIVTMTARNPDKRLDSLEEVVRRLTTAPSEKMGLVRTSYEKALEVDTVDSFFVLFYDNLREQLARGPSASQWDKFARTQWSAQRSKLAEGIALLLAFHALDDGKREPTSLSRIAKAHGPSGYGVDPRSFKVFGRALVDTVIQTLKPKPEDRPLLEEAWTHVLEDGLAYLSRKARNNPAELAAEPAK